MISKLHPNHPKMRGCLNHLNAGQLGEVNFDKWPAGNDGTLPAVYSEFSYDDSDNVWIKKLSSRSNPKFPHFIPLEVQDWLNSNVTGFWFFRCLGSEDGVVKFWFFFENETDSIQFTLRYGS